MTDAAKYVTEDAYTAVLIDREMRKNHGRGQNTRQILEAAAPHIVAAAEPHIQAAALAEIQRLNLRYIDGINKGRAQATAEAEQGRGPAAAAALRWLNEEQVRRFGVAQTWIDVLADQAEATEDQP